ncbi:MAG: hypothetical protein IT360_25235 [Gemmatimonadaceae bacterium]|nr:hypothetical protein [Gemmatimonadaceae bacterium]
MSVEQLRATAVATPTGALVFVLFGVSCCGCGAGSDDIPHDATADDAATTEDVAGEVVDDRELPTYYPDEVRAMPLAELVWTYHPPNPDRFVDSRQQVAVAANDSLIVVQTFLRSPGALARELTGLSPAGQELWHALVPRAIERVPPVLDRDGATWILGNETAGDFGPRRAFAYRVDRLGNVLWERNVTGAEGDLQAPQVGHKTAAMAVDRDLNAYGVVGHSAFSLDAAGEVRWRALFTGGPVQLPCETAQTSFSPIVHGDHVFFASDCGTFVFTRDGQVVGRHDPWGGDSPVLTPEGWLTRILAGAGRGIVAVDVAGQVMLTWPDARAGSHVFGADGRGDGGVRAWDGASSPWVYSGQHSSGSAWRTDTDGWLMVIHSIYGEVAVVDRHGRVLSDVLIGRAIRGDPPVSAVPGEYVFRGQSYDDDSPTMLTCVRLPFGPLPTTSWATRNANFRNTRASP